MTCDTAVPETFELVVVTNCGVAPQAPPSPPSAADAVTVHEPHEVLIVPYADTGMAGMCTTITHNALEHDAGGVAFVKVNLSAGDIADEPAAVVTTTSAICATACLGVVAESDVLLVCVNVAGLPLNSTLVAPARFDPVMVTWCRRRSRPPPGAPR